MERNVIGNGLAGVVGIQAVQGLETGVGDLVDALAHLDLVCIDSIMLHCRQLIHAAEYR